LLVSNKARRGINSTANKESPLKWTESFIESAFSPLERTLAISKGIDSLAGVQVGAKGSIPIVQIHFLVGQASCLSKLKGGQDAHPTRN
jgi:hypothetical protein